MLKRWIFNLFNVIGIVFLLGLFAMMSSVNALENGTVRLNDRTVQQGSQTTMTLSIHDVSNYSALEIHVYYDSDLFTVNGGYYNSSHNHFPMHQKAFNVENPGVISYALAITEEISYSGSLFHFYVQAKSLTPAGDYTLQVAVVGVYNNEQESITVGGEHGTLTVTEPQPSVHSIHFGSSVS